MEITEEKLNELFGVTPENNSENTQEAADPAGNTEPERTESGEKVQEPAEPETDPEGQTEEGTTETDGKDGQTAEQRRANAARRRQKEEQDRVNAAVSKALEEEREKSAMAMKDFFARAGLKNSITGEPITSIKEFNEWNDQFSKAKLEKDLAAGKVTADELDKIIEQSPQMQEARQKAQQYEQMRQQDLAAQAKKAVESDLAKVHEIDPSISTIEDLKKMPNYPEFESLVIKGLTFEQAYKAVNYSRAADTRAAAAKQAAMNNQRGKEHLNGTGATRGNGDKNVPAEEMRMFRVFNPNATEAEIREYYNRMAQQKG